MKAVTSRSNPASKAAPMRALRASQRSPRVRVFVVDELRLYAAGVGELIARDHSIAVVGTGSTDPTALEQIALRRPRVILACGASARDKTFITKALEMSSRSCVLAVGIKANEFDVLRSAEAGVRGYVGSDATMAELLRSIRALDEGRFPCPTEIAAILLRSTAHSVSRGTGDEIVHEPHRLTTREREILDLVNQALTNKEIAAALAIRVPTVKNHVHHILEKLGVHRRGAAAAVIRFA